MRTAVVDASVVVDLLVDLGTSSEANRFFAALVEGDEERSLWAPDLIHVEVASALRKLVLRRHLPSASGGTAIAHAARLPIRTVSVAPLMSDVWDLRASVTPYDACYIALARRLDCPLVTADERLVRAFARSSADWVVSPAAGWTTP